MPRTYLDPDLGPVRVCRLCDEAWPLDAEYFYRRTDGGYEGVCIACWTERRRASRAPKAPRLCDRQRIREGVTEHRCLCCDRWLPATLEHWRAQRRGLGGLDQHCLECRARERRRAAAHVTQRLAEIAA